MNLWLFYWKQWQWIIWDDTFFFPELVLPNSLFNYTMLRWNTVKYSDITTQNGCKRNREGFTKKKKKSSHDSQKPSRDLHLLKVKTVAGDSSLNSDNDKHSNPYVKNKYILYSDMTEATNGHICTFLWGEKEMRV